MFETFMISKKKYIFNALRIVVFKLSVQTIGEKQEAVVRRVSQQTPDGGGHRKSLL